MTTTLDTNTIAAPMQVQMYGEYEIYGDAALRHENRLLRGVWLTDSGAYAGTLEADPLGDFVSVVMTEDGMLPAPEGWEAAIVRALPGVGENKVAWNSQTQTAA